MRKQAPHFYGQLGQGVIEYAGAMVVAGMLAMFVITGAHDNGWMHQVYQTVFDAAGSVLLGQLAAL